MTTYEILSLVGPLMSGFIIYSLTRLESRMNSIEQRLENRINIVEEKFDRRIKHVEKELYFIKGLLTGKQNTECNNSN